MVEIKFRHNYEFFIDYQMNQQLLDFYQLLTEDAQEMLRRMCEEKKRRKRFIEKDFKKVCNLHFKNSSINQSIYNKACEFYRVQEYDINAIFNIPKTFYKICKDYIEIRISEDKTIPRVILPYSKPEEFKKYETYSLSLGYGDLRIGIYQIHEYKSTPTPEYISLNDIKNIYEVPRPTMLGIITNNDITQHTVDNKPHISMIDFYEHFDLFIKKHIKMTEGEKERLDENSKKVNDELRKYDEFNCPID